MLHQLAFVLVFDYSILSISDLAFDEKLPKAVMDLFERVDNERTKVD